MAESRGMNIVRSSDGSILFRVVAFDAADAKITTGNVVMRLWHIIPTTGALETYDFDDDTFKTGAITTETANLTHRTAEAGSFNTGLWTRRHTTLTAFVVGDKYVVEFSHASLPRPVTAEFQYGDLEGDQATLLPDFVWDENIVSAHGTSNTAGLLLRVLGALISQRSNNSTLSALLGIPDVAGRNLADAIWDEVLDGAHAVGDSGAQRLKAVDDLTQTGGAGDLAAVRVAASKVDDATTDASPAAGSIAAKLGTLITASAAQVTGIRTSINFEGSQLRIEAAVEKSGIVQTAPYTQAQAQIFNDAGGLVENIGIGDFGAINARGWFGHTLTSHSLVAGNTYQIFVQIDDGAADIITDTKTFKTIQG